ncbi:Phage integrase, N-terminal SAM-like domain [Gracilibacillus ureilyticus]|uniref:Phage integrase, N-terminal SAM-like domain n=1 Tax=Gracilibacillus ureilyticus TaxID=531814 RepID=A0A1H9T830_9BACI|nr:phage integrase N-terminal SAM-like domain-containing protein [Gracilibacillus ureilyticus]SER92909.1 Phage integrase, N-terminal SAM-like domain [Gracilibacillus ureilyticus]
MERIHECFLEHSVKVGKVSYTVKTYKSMFCQFEQWLEKKCITNYPEAIMPRHIVNYIDDLESNRKLSKAMVKKYILLLKIFFDYLVDRDLIY